MSVSPIIEPEVTRPTQTHNSRTDRPVGLTRDEERAYVQGYARGCLAYVRKHGGAAMTVRAGEKASPGALAALARDHEAERHPTAHRAALASLRAWLRKYGSPERLAVVEQAIKGKPALSSTTRTTRTTRKATTTTTTKGSTMSNTVTAAARKPATRKPALSAVPARPAADEKPARRPTMAERKAFRRGLAAAMREAGVPMSPENWEASKAAGKPVAV